MGLRLGLCNQQKSEYNFWSSFTNCWLSLPHQWGMYLSQQTVPIPRLVLVFEIWPLMLHLSWSHCCDLSLCWVSVAAAGGCSKWKAGWCETAVRQRCFCELQGHRGWLLCKFCDQILLFVKTSSSGACWNTENRRCDYATFKVNANKWLFVDASLKQHSQLTWTR